jgi:hypothetical protein
MSRAGAKQRSGLPVEGGNNSSNVSESYYIVFK